MLSLSLSPNPHKACSHIPLSLFCLSNCCGLKRRMVRGDEIERKRQKEGESEGKGVIPQKLCSQDKLYWPPGIVNSCVWCVRAHASSTIALLTQKRNHLANSPKFYNVKYKSIYTLPWVLRWLQQGQSIKRGLCFFSAPQNYLIVDS